MTFSNGATALPERFSQLSECAPGTPGYDFHKKILSLVRRGASLELLGDECDSPLYAWCGIQESDEIRNKVFKRNPRISWNFRVPGQDDTSIIIKPVYRKIDKERHDPDFSIAYHDSKGTHTFANRHDVILIQPGFRSFGFVDHLDYYLAMAGGKEIAKIVRDFYYAFDANPLAIFALESDRCCFCRKPLTDKVSRSRGVGPDCFRGWESLARRQGGAA